MKIQINKDGILEIERAGEMAKQICPFSHTDGAQDFTYCGDLCPLFGEPVEKDGEFSLSLCQRSFYYMTKNEFSDLRYLNLKEKK